MVHLGRPVRRITGMIALTVAVAALPVRGGAFDGLVRSLETNTDYTRPFATLLGTMTNGGWYQSASVGRGFGFYVGLPISLTYIGRHDRSFETTYVDENCQLCNEMIARYPDNNISNAGCVESQTFSTPTVFGRDAPPVIQVVSGLDMFGNVTQIRSQYYSSGIEELARLNWLPFATLQIAASFFHTELKVRYIGLPLEKFSIHLPGIGIQHDLGWVLPDVVPVSVSVAANFTRLSAGWAPGDNIGGRLELSGLSNFAGVLVGYRMRMLEVFLQGGWERSFLQTSGSMTIETDDGVIETIEPAVRLDGRNAVRFGLNVAIPIGFSPVAGHSFGANMNTNLNIFGFRYPGPRKDK